MADVKAAEVVETPKEAVEIKAIEEAKESALKAVAEAEVKVTAAEARAVAAEAKLKAAAEYVQTEDEYLAKAPESIRTLVAEKKAQDALQKATLVGQLKTAAAGIFTEEELVAKSIPDLMKLAQMAKVDAPKPDYSGRAVPRVAAATEDYSAPDPYAEAVKALQARAN